MITVNGYAKINLTLDILGKRPDGFHEVAMVMQSLALNDTLTLEKDAGIKLTIEGSDLPADDTNLAWRAADLMRRECNIGGADIKLTKRIPIAAGLAGGSADAAAVLRGLNELYGLNLSWADLAKLGAKLGSDIPFCLYGGTMLATGRGEILTPMDALPKTQIVLAKPPISISTPWAYREYDALTEVNHPDNDAMQKAIASGNIMEVASLLGNVLEGVAVAAYPVIEEYKQAMLSQGAIAAMMSGSGPTVFALTKDEVVANKIAAYLEANTQAQVVVTQTTAGNY
ncbi:MAG: 4-(cytidine 5'-diphospho)-2-C-methyl-D-erythritol kinase [Selenomonadaceae bacterium]|nr:4-(cytidine 5'-diphospho)-2-C-methyl-D-erythritol kinase [Selenomonadaceae bacterium]